MDNYLSLSHIKVNTKTTKIITNFFYASSLNYKYTVNYSGILERWMGLSSDTLIPLRMIAEVYTL